MSAVEMGWTCYESGVEKGKNCHGQTVICKSLPTDFHVMLISLSVKFLNSVMPLIVTL
jgi:hypothetical protein